MEDFTCILYNIQYNYQIHVRKIANLPTQVETVSSSVELGTAKVCTVGTLPVWGK